MMRNSFMLLLSFFLVGFMYSQDSITGLVTDSSGSPLPGVSVVIEGASMGVTTDFDGNYKIEVNQGVNLLFSYVGMITQTVLVDKGVINVRMEEDLTNLDQVVVTAFGEKQNKKAIAYSNQVIKSEVVSKVKLPDFTKSLQGKIAGLNISPGTSGVGSAPRIRLRGNRSLAANNQPLVIIDGLRMSNFTPSTSGFDTFGGSGANFNQGNNLGLINPDDIDSVTVLKGASAAALYGGAAANGVLIITTKEGKANQTRVNVSSGTAFVSPLTKRDLLDDSAVSELLGVGLSSVNTVSLSTGTDKAIFYGSYGYTKKDGILLNNSLDKQNLSLRAKFNVNDKLTINSKLMYFKQNAVGQPSVGLYLNPLTGIYLNKGADVLSYVDDYQGFDNVRKIPTQNWLADLDINPNPWYVQNNALVESERNRVLFLAGLKYDFTDNLSLQARVNVDNTEVNTNRNIVGKVTAVSPSNGRYVKNEYNSKLTVGDLILKYNKKIGDDLNFKALLGGTIIDNQLTGYTFDNGTSNNLFVPNYFSVSNLPPGSTKNELYSASQTRAAFFSGELDYKDMLFLTLTARNDWSSTLPADDNSFFYPSVGLSFVLNEAVELPEQISLLKLRGSFAEVGNTLPPFINNLGRSVNNQGNVLNFNAIPQPGKTLVPEKTSSFEFGLDLNLFEDLLTLSGTYYKTNTFNQLFTIQAPTGSLASNFYVNGGDVQNTGFELQLGVNPIKTNDFSWNIGINTSKNTNEVLELSEGINTFVITPGGVNSFANILEVGGSFGDIYAPVVQKDEQGRIKITKKEDGSYSVSRADLGKVANPNNQLLFGISNTFNYKNLSFSFLIDSRFGGEIMDMTGAVIDGFDNSPNLEGNFNGNFALVDSEGNFLNEVSSIPAVDYYASVSGRAGITDRYIYSATNIRLRQLSIGYNMDFGNNMFLKGMYIALTGRNLLFLYKDAPFDPEVTSIPGNGLQGVNLFALPTTRQIGLNVSLNF